MIQKTIITEQRTRLEKLTSAVQEYRLSLQNGGQIESLFETIFRVATHLRYFFSRTSQEL